MSRVLCVDLPPGALRELRDTGHEVIALEAGLAAQAVAAVAEQEDVEALAVGDPAYGAALVAHLDQDTVVFWVTSGSGTS